MKKNSIFTAVIAATLINVSSAYAVDGTINFTGTILDSACTIDIGVGSTMTVNLGTVAASSFTGLGSKASASEFVITLNACPEAVTTAKIKFDGSAYNGDNNVLALTGGAGVATGVGIELTDSSANVLPLATSSAAYTLTPAVANELTFKARYIAMAGTVTAGTANSVATFTVNYN